MISKADLKLLVNKRILDARALIAKRRYAASIYLCGYAIELTLKYRICHLLQFSKGFPENKNEFNLYYTDTKKTLLRSTIRDIREIKIHDLDKLLFFSGDELRVKRDLKFEWGVVSQWKVEDRYSTKIIREKRATEYFRAAQDLIKSII